ncbi:MAG: hypothetical protein GY774_15615 [Planctomycetes bacterium]|nr:hypothetical protein [Planctomycetota bacterium]
MAVNHADGTMFVSIVLYPIVAGKAALSQGLEWLMLLFIPLSLGIGIVVIYLGRKMIYGMLGSCLKRREPMKAWIQQILEIPRMLLYIALPFVIIGIGLYVTWVGSVWLAQRIAQM